MLYDTNVLPAFFRRALADYAGAMVRAARRDDRGQFAVAERAYERMEDTALDWLANHGHQ